MAVPYRPTPLDKNIYQKEVKRELKGKRYLNAIFLLHSYIESFMREHLLLLGESKERTTPNEDVEDLERIGFSNYVKIHFMLGIINERTYARLKEFNKYRNTLAHDLVKIPLFRNTKFQKEMERKAKSGLKICDQIYSNYEKLLDQKAENIESWAADEYADSHEYR